MADFINTIDLLGDDAVIDSIIDRSITEFKDDILTKAGIDAFCGCTSLKNVLLPNCSYIGSGTFNSCTALEEISLPNLVTSYGANFKGCTALKTIDFPKLTVIDADCFSGTAVESVCFPSVTKCNPRIFQNSPLRIIDLPVCTSLVANVFYICTNLIALILRNPDTVCTASTTTLFNGNWSGTNGPIMNGTGFIYVPKALIEDYKVATNWSTWATQFRALEDYTIDGTTTGEFRLENPALDISNKHVTFGTITHVTISLERYESIPTVQVISSNTNIVSVENITVSLDSLEFDLIAKNTEDTAVITMTVTGVETYSDSFNVNVMNELPESSYTIEPIDGVTYGFALNSSGYYESTNKGVADSFALCKINIMNPRGLQVYLKCINYGENGNDYGMLSNVNTELSATNTKDSSGIFKSFENSSMTSKQTIRYGVISEGFIYVKYIKDSAINLYNDSLQFTVEFA